jgi:hypothetical protein
MEDDTNSETELETFDVEFTASELYSLHGLLRYLSIDMDHRNSVVAQSLAKQVHDTMATNDFSNAMEEEMNEFEEMMQKSPDDMMGGGAKDFSMGGFQ